MRVVLVKKARKCAGKCCKCQATVRKGQPYSWIKFRNEPRLVACQKCNFTRSDLTKSDKLARVYAAQDEALKAVAEWNGEDLDDLRQELSTCAEATGTPRCRGPRS